MDEHSTFLSNSGGNLMDLRSLSSLSENLRSWSAEVPLKKPCEMNGRVSEETGARGGGVRSNLHPPLRDIEARMSCGGESVDGLLCRGRGNIA